MPKVTPDPTQPPSDPAAVPWGYDPQGGGGFMRIPTNPDWPPVAGSPSPPADVSPPRETMQPPAAVQPIADQGPAAKIPYGPVKGTPHLLPQFQNLGRVRPFGPGEWIDQGGGNWGSEETWTVPVGNKWMVVPGLWLVNGVPTHVNEDQAAQYAQQSGLIWPTFDDQTAADKFSNDREQVWERTPKGRSDMQPPLWNRRWPPPR